MLDKRDYDSFNQEAGLLKAHPSHGAFKVCLLAFKTWYVSLHVNIMQQFENEHQIERHNNSVLYIGLHLASRGYQRPH